MVKKKTQKKSVLRTLPRQLQYDGKSNWLHFKHKFIKYAELSDWTAEECLDCLSWCLTEKAADFCATLMERTKHLSYRKLMKRLDDRFSDRELPASAQVRFQQAFPEERRVFGRLGGLSVDHIWQSVLGIAREVQ